MKGIHGIGQVTAGQGLDASSFEARVIRPDDGLISPYGGVLVDAYAEGAQRDALLSRAASLPRIDLSDTELADIALIAGGAYSPLTGFMDELTYRSVLESSRLPNGLPWGMPVTLAVDAAVRSALLAVREAALFHAGRPVAVMQVEDVYRWDAAREALDVYGVEDSRHSDLGGRASSVHFLVGGPIIAIADLSDVKGVGACVTAWQSRAVMTERAWNSVALLRMATPWQRTHEYAIKTVLEGHDGVVLADSAASDDTIPADVIDDSSHVLVDRYLPGGRIVRGLVPQLAHHAGSRVTLHQAIVSRNYGCGILYLVRDPAAEPARVAAGPELRDTGVTVVAMEPAFHCEDCGGIATRRSCPHGDDARLVFSPHDVYDMLLRGEQLPPQLARAEVARTMAKSISRHVKAIDVQGATNIHPHVGEVSRELRQAMAGHKAFVLWMTGLSGSGKSTIAHRLERRLLLSGHRVFVLDGDTLRHGLNRDLGFSEEARRENLRRAGEVAKVMLESGTIVIASFISPFRAERNMVRELFPAGDFFEAYVEASLDDCEARDPKGLYKRARAGLIPNFTGISSPYEAPESPDILLNTSHRSAEECAQQVIALMGERGLLRAGSGSGTGASRQLSVFGGNQVSLQ